MDVPFSSRFSKSVIEDLNCCDGIYLLISLNEENLIKKVENWLKYIEEYGDKYINFVIVGTKSDLESKVDKNEFEIEMKNRNLDFFKFTIKGERLQHYYQLDDITSFLIKNIWEKLKIEFECSQME